MQHLMVSRVLAQLSTDGASPFSSQKNGPYTIVLGRLLRSARKRPKSFRAILTRFSPQPFFYEFLLPGSGYSAANETWINTLTATR